MYPFWDPVVWPLLQAAKARRIVEIGALRGETTVLMLERLGSDAELHVIDPVPEFDPAEHEQRFPGRYIFHRDISHNVLPGLPPMDVALVDGDHNWFTVYHELRLLSETARREGAPLPVLILHDVLWPYGRRDLYYAPERIPEEFRQPNALRGIRPGTKEVLPRGGLNPEHYNALVEGGPRNGVMTALDDFIAEYDRPLRRLVLPVYFGLAIVVEEERLARQPELARLLDWLESAEGKDVLLEIGESTRLQAMLFQHNDYYGHRDRHPALARTATSTSWRPRSSTSCTSTTSCASPTSSTAFVATSRPNGRGSAIRSARCRSDGTCSSSGAGREPCPTRDARVPSCRTPSSGAPASIISVGASTSCATNASKATSSTAAPVAAARRFSCAGYLDACELDRKQVWIADAFRVEQDAEDPLDVWTDLNTVRDAFARFGLLDDRVRFLQGRPGRFARRFADPTNCTDAHRAR